jgi:hypothetical protein
VALLTFGAGVIIVTGVALTGLPQLAIIAKANWLLCIMTKAGRDEVWNDTLGGRMKKVFWPMVTESLPDIS